MTKIFFLFVILCLASATSYPQFAGGSLNYGEPGDSVKSRHNPLSDNAKTNMAYIYNPGVSFRNSKPLTIGYEISGYTFYKDFPYIEIYGAGLSLYRGKSYISDKRTDGYGELSQLDRIYLNNTFKYRSSDSYIYIDPGISMFSKGRKFSIDLFHKFSTPVIIEGMQPVLPYKVNIRF